MTIPNIIEELKTLEREIQDLKRNKAQTEIFLAAIVKKHSGEISINFNDLVGAEHRKVKLFPIDETNDTVIIKYVEDVTEDETNKNY